MQLPKKRTTQ